MRLDRLKDEVRDQRAGHSTQAGSYASNVTYYPNGAIAGFTYGNGIGHTLTQNTRGLQGVELPAELEKLFA